jgi:capsular exopolysaccharide synthesis family protein
VRDYGVILWRRKWVVLVPLVVATLVALGASALQTPIYSTSAQVLIQPRGQDGLFDTSEQTLNDRAIETEIKVVEGEAVRRRVQDNLGLPVAPPPANASALGGTDVISISVRGTSPENVATVADAYAAAYIEVRREQSVDQLVAASTEVQLAVDELQSEIDTLSEDDPLRSTLVSQQANLKTTLDQLRVDAALRTGGATIIQTAPVPSEPVEPNIGRTVVVAATVGLLVGIGAALLLAYLDDRVRTMRQLEEVGRLPVLAEVPVDPPPGDLPVAVSEPTHESVEDFRGLRTNLLFIGLDRPVCVIQVTSSLAGEGKTTVAANLAVVLAHAGHNVALVDADLRRPRIHEMFSFAIAPGLTDVLLGDQPADAVRSVEVGGGVSIAVYTAGTVASNPSELLSSPRVEQLFQRFRQEFDYVVVDSAPIVPVSDSVALTSAVDTVLVVAQAGRVSSRDLRACVERLSQVGAPAVGAILNQSVDRRRTSYGYGGYQAPPGNAVPLTDEERAVTRS